MATPSAQFSLTPGVEINSVVALPGVLRGALDARATAIGEEMKLPAVS
jgi:malic enzyme